MAGKSKEFKRFEDTLKKVLSVSHDELKRRMEAEKAAKASRPVSARAKGGKD